MEIPERIKAVIFDYDGVLGDSGPFNSYACKESAKMCNINLTTDVYELCAPGGATIHDIATCIVSHYGHPELVDQFVKYKKTFDKDYVQEVTILSNVVLTLERLALHYPLAINTGTRHILVDSFLEKYALIKYFKAIVAAEDIVHGKPNPESYLKAAKLLDTAPENCLVVEDGSSGIKAGLSAGCYIVGITNSLSKGELQQLGCNAIISDLAEITVPTAA